MGLQMKRDEGIHVSQYLELGVLVLVYKEQDRACCGFEGSKRQKREAQVGESHNWRLKKERMRRKMEDKKETYCSALVC